jgi:hypothetical protein
MEDHSKSRAVVSFRRPCETIDIDCRGIPHVAGFGWQDEEKMGAPFEVFFRAAKPDSSADDYASDAGRIISIALQFGATIELLRRRVNREADGSPSSPIGAVLDAMWALRMSED